MFTLCLQWIILHIMPTACLVWHWCIKLIPTSEEIVLNIVNSGRCFGSFVRQRRLYAVCIYDGKLWRAVSSTLHFVLCRCCAFFYVAKGRYHLIYKAKQCSHNSGYISAAAERLIIRTVCNHRNRHICHAVSSTLHFVLCRCCAFFYVQRKDGAEKRAEGGDGTLYKNWLCASSCQHQHLKFLIALQNVNILFQLHFFRCSDGPDYWTSDW